MLVTLFLQHAPLLMNVKKPRLLKSVSQQWGQIFFSKRSTLLKKEAHRACHKTPLTSLTHPFFAKKTGISIGAFLRKQLQIACVHLNRGQDPTLIGMKKY